jgi:hypothetical protein
MSTYGDLLPQIKRNAGNKDESDFEATILSAFNAAQRTLAWASDWPELEVETTGAFTIGTNEYTQSDLSLTRFMKPQDLLLLPTGERGLPMEYISPRRWRKEVAPLIPTATRYKPGVFTIWGVKFLFYPVPDVAYPFNFWYRQYPQTVIDISSVIQYTDADDLLIDLSTALTFLSYEEFNAAQVWLKKSEVWMKSFEIGTEFMGMLEAAFKSATTKSSTLLQTDYWRDPFAKEMP